LKARTLGICILSMTVMVFASPSLVQRAHASLCGSNYTYGTASWTPVTGKYVEITAVACGIGSGTFSSTHNEVKCSTSSPASDWSFGSGSYDFIGYKRDWSVAFSQYVSTTNICPNSSLNLGSTGTWELWTGDGSPLYTLTVTYVPTGASTTLSTFGFDCATSNCPI
jgi:hypothetical protein